MVLVVCERCSTLLAVGLSNCPHCSAPPAEQHEFGTRPEDDDHPMMGRIPGMAKITRNAGPTDATVPAETEPVQEETAPEPVEAEPQPQPERPGSKGTRQAWLDWAAASGYHVPCAEALTVAQLSVLPDGPPDYDEDGLLVAPQDSTEETVAAVEVYNAKAIDLYEPEPGGEDAEDVTAGGPDEGDG